MKRISTHVLDIARGKPAAGVGVRLERQEPSGDWLLLNHAPTGQDGRCAQLLSDGELLPGLHRLVFDTGAYFRAANVESIYPLVAVTFEVRANDSEFHIPLLLSPNGYTTYRGS
jgi:5-hydroxyisourate hydrolase